MVQWLDHIRACLKVIELTTCTKWKILTKKLYHIFHVAISRIRPDDNVSRICLKGLLTTCNVGPAWTCVFFNVRSFFSRHMSSRRQIVQVQQLLLNHQAHLKSNRYMYRRSKGNNSRNSFSKINSKLSNFKNCSKFQIVNQKNNVPTPALPHTCRHLLPWGKELPRGRCRKMVCYKEGRDSQAREWKKLKVLHCRISKPLLQPVVQVWKTFAKRTLLNYFMLEIEFFHLYVGELEMCFKFKVKIYIQNKYNVGFFQANLVGNYWVLFSNYTRVQVKKQWILWFDSDRSIVYYPVTIKHRICKQTSKPQTKLLQC